MLVPGVAIKIVSIGAADVVVVVVCAMTDIVVFVAWLRPIFKSDFANGVVIKIDPKVSLFEIKVLKRQLRSNLVVREVE